MESFEAKLLSTENEVFSESRRIGKLYSTLLNFNDILGTFN